MFRSPGMCIYPCFTLRRWAETLRVIAYGNYYQAAEIHHFHRLCLHDQFPQTFFKWIDRYDFGNWMHEMLLHHSSQRKPRKRRNFAAEETKHSCIHARFP